jgi:hypothetical protein
LVLSPGWIPVLVPAAWLHIAPGQELRLAEVPDYAPSAFEREYGRHVTIAYPAEGFGGLRERLRQHGADLVAPPRPTAAERFFIPDTNRYLLEAVAAANRKPWAQPPGRAPLVGSGLAWASYLPNF